MARGDSTVIVRLVGDVKDLASKLTKSDALLKGFGAGAGIAGFNATLRGLGGAVDLVGDALAKADQHGDALQQLSRTLTPELATNLDNMAGSMAKIGLSKTDFDSLAADFANLGTAAGLTKTQIADLAPSVVGVAQAFALADPKGRSVTDILELMEKAAGGSAKAAAELGVAVDPTASKLDNMKSIVAQLNPLLDQTTTGSGDLELAQKKLHAQLDNVEQELGDKLAPALATVLGFINDEIDAIPGAIAGWQALGKVISDFGANALGPLARVKDLLDAITPNVQGLLNPTSIFGGGGAQTPSESSIIAAQRNHNARNGLGAP